MTPEEFDKQLTPAALEDLKRDVLTRITLTAEAAVKPRVPVLTGTLRRSITSRVDVQASLGAVGTNVIYAPYVNRKRRFMEAGLDAARRDVDRILTEAGEGFWASVIS
jgi:hypothetical protein